MSPNSSTRHGSFFKALVVMKTPKSAESAVRAKSVVKVLLGCWMEVMGLIAAQRVKF